MFMIKLIIIAVQRLSEPQFEVENKKSSLWNFTIFSSGMSLNFCWF